MKLIFSKVIRYSQLLILVVLFCSCEKYESNVATLGSRMVVDESYYAYLSRPRDILPYTDGYYLITKEGALLAYDDSMRFQNELEVFNDSLYNLCVKTINKNIPEVDFNKDSTYEETLNSMNVSKWVKQKMYRSSPKSRGWVIVGISGVFTINHKDYGNGKAVGGGGYFIMPLQSSDSILDGIYLIHLEPRDTEIYVANPAQAFLVKDNTLFTSLLVSPFRQGFEKVASFSLDAERQVATFDRIHSIAKHPSNMEAIYGEELYTVESFFESKEGEVLYVNGGEIVNLTTNTIDYQVDCARCILYDAGYIGDEIYGLIMVKDEEKFTSRLYLQNMENPDETIDVDHEDHLFGKFYGGKWYNMTKDDEKVYLTIMGVE